MKRILILILFICSGCAIVMTPADLKKEEGVIHETYTVNSPIFETFKAYKEYGEREFTTYQSIIRSQYYGEKEGATVSLVGYVNNPYGIIDKTDIHFEFKANGTKTIVSVWCIKSGVKVYGGFKELLD